MFNITTVNFGTQPKTREFDDARQRASLTTRGNKRWDANFFSRTAFVNYNFTSWVLAGPCGRIRSVVFSVQSCFSVQCNYII